MFQGFSEAAIQFLWGISLHNEKSWFEAHKTEYAQSVQKPMKALAAQVQQAFLTRHPELCLNFRVCRIYRDARRLHGRGPYKNSLWFSLRRDDREWTRFPAFWFELRPTGYGFGMGIYSAAPALMARFRQIVDQAPGKMKALAEKFAGQNQFRLDAPEYKRSKGNPPPPLDQWYNRKTIALTCNREPDALLGSPALAEEVLRGFTFLLPYYRYFEALCLQGEDTLPAQDSANGLKGRLF